MIYWLSQWKIRDYKQREVSNTNTLSVIKSQQDQKHKEQVPMSRVVHTLNIVGKNSARKPSTLDNPLTTEFTARYHNNELSPWFRPQLFPEQVRKFLKFLLFIYP